MDTFGRDNPFLPSEASSRLLRLLWQLEVWLREMVYVELRARDADWQEPIKKVVQNWPPRSLDSDKRLTHMATRHESAISYLTLGELLRIIRDQANWSLFASYFPPRDNFEIRMAEISQIRNRVAHFRDPHHTDVDRVILFLRDLDEGFWRFASSYAREELHIPDGLAEPISEYFDATHDRRRIVEMKKLGSGWRHANTDRAEPLLHFGIYASLRPWFEKRAGADLIGRSGFVYHAFFQAPVGRYLPLNDILELTESVHANCMHIRIESHSIEVIVPSILGKDLVVATIEEFLERSMGSVHRGDRFDEERVEKVASEWPEYVLGPSNPLGAFGRDVSCQMFALDWY